MGNELEYEFIKENFTDSRKTLFESFMLSKIDIQQSHGYAWEFYRNTINPNLTWNYSTEYLDEHFCPVMIKYFNQNDELIRTEKFDKEDK